MKAVIVSNTEIKYHEVSVLKIKNSNGVIVDVLCVGLCGSDVQRIDIILKNKIDHVVLGHEIIGIVNSVGSRVRKTIKKGDFVVVAPILSCKKCVFCRHGNTQFCLKGGSLGKTIDGGFAEQVFIPNINNLYKINKEHFCKELVLADPLAVCIHACNKVNILQGKSIAIIGDGAIGEILSRYLVLQEVKKIMIIGKNCKNKVSKHNGIKISYKNISNILQENNKESFDVVFECVGRAEEQPFDVAIKIVKKGGEIIVVGAYKPNYYLPVNARILFSKEITIKGANSYSSFDKKDEFSEAVRMIADKKIKLGNIITHVLPLKNFTDGLELFKIKKVSGAKKVVFVN